MAKGSSDKEILRREYETAQKRLEQQSATMDSFAENGYQMLRILLLLTGALVTLGSTFQEEFVKEVVTNQQCVFMASLLGCISVGQLAKFALMFLGLSIVSYGIAAGKEARGIGSICTKDDITRTIESASTEQEHLSERLQRYRSRIDDNDAVIDFTEGLLAFGGTCLILSLVPMLFVSYTAATGTTFSSELVILIVALLVGRFLIQLRKLPNRYLLAEGMLSVYLLKLHPNRENTDSDAD